MWIAYLSYFALGEGILIYSGTGSIGYYLSADKEVIRVGGRGNLIDDGGSGLLDCPRGPQGHPARRGGEPRTGLVDDPRHLHVAAPLGGTDWNVVRAFVYGGDRGKIGELARVVGEAAEKGDATAEGILRAAGAELARLANALFKRLAPRPVALVGGAFRIHPHHRRIVPPGSSRPGGGDQ